MIVTVELNNGQIAERHFKK